MRTDGIFSHDDFRRAYGLHRDFGAAYDAWREAGGLERAYQVGAVFPVLLPFMAAVNDARRRTDDDKGTATDVDRAVADLAAVRAVVGLADPEVIVTTKAIGDVLATLDVAIRDLERFRCARHNPSPLAGLLLAREIIAALPGAPQRRGPGRKRHALKAAATAAMRRRGFTDSQIADFFAALGYGAASTRSIAATARRADRRANPEAPRRPRGRPPKKTK